MHPNLASSEATKMQTYIHHIFRNSGVKPITDKKIVFGPLKISRVGGIAFDMRNQIEATKDHLEEGAQLGAVMRLKVQCIGNKGLDVDVVDGLDKGTPRAAQVDGPLLSVRRAGDESASEATGAVAAGAVRSPKVGTVEDMAKEPKDQDRRTRDTM
jgi:hypothetical protein